MIARIEERMSVKRIWRSLEKESALKYWRNQKLIGMGGNETNNLARTFVGILVLVLETLNKVQMLL